MKIILYHPRRETELRGPKSVQSLLRELRLIPEAHLVIRGDELLTEDQTVSDSDVVEVRPVISGGSDRVTTHKGLV